MHVTSCIKSKHEFVIYQVYHTLIYVDFIKISIRYIVSVQWLNNVLLSLKIVTCITTIDKSCRIKSRRISLGYKMRVIHGR